MASRGAGSSAFQRINPSSCASLNSSFSIRNILNLPEENAEECVPSSGVASSLDGCTVSLPLVPRVVHPLAYPYGDDLSRRDLLNRREFGLVPQLSTQRQHRGAFGEHRFSSGFKVYQKKPRRPMRRKKQRPLFSPHKIQTMEEEFDKHRYISEEKRSQLASDLNLTETQVKTWFQNRRTKWKKETRDKGDASSRVETQRLLQESTWQSLPGVQGHHFYTTPFPLSNSSDTTLHEFAPHYSVFSIIPSFGTNASFLA